MPAILDDPGSPTIFRVSGAPPFPDPEHPALPPDIGPRQVTLRDRQTVATVVPFASRELVPPSLAAYLCEQLNREIDVGDTYPMTEPFAPEAFTNYWFQNLGAVMLLGEVDGAEAVAEGTDWASQCLGSFYIKPNYPGRSSHVCNGGFLVTEAARNRGVGRLMGEAYIDWAPRLGYTYSVFNLVYETNVASCKIWDALGFKRIGRVKGCGNLRSYPDRLVDAIIYGRDMAPADAADAEELVSEERFDKIKFYLKYARYPHGADRAEKSRLRSAATHYKLLDGDKLMLKDKEVIADPARQYDIARAVHVQHHGGINRTTATIAEKYHWSRIKETVSDVIRNCSECAKELGKAPNAGAAGGANAAAAVSAARKPPVVAISADPSLGVGVGGMGTEPPDHDAGVDIDGADGMASAAAAASRVFELQDHDIMSTLPPQDAGHSPSSGYANPSDISVLTSSAHGFPRSDADPHQIHGLHHHHHHHHHPHDHHHRHHATQPHNNPMLQDHPHGHSHQHTNSHASHASATDDAVAAAAAGASPVYQPIDPQIINRAPDQPPGDPFEPYHAHDAAADFQALLSATEDEQAVDRDLDMLIEHGDDDDDDDVVDRHDHDHVGRTRDDKFLGGSGGDGSGEKKDGDMYDVQFGESGS